MRRSHRRRKQYDGSQQRPIRTHRNSSEQHGQAAGASIDAPPGGLSPELRAAFLRSITAEDRRFLARYITSLGFTGADHADLVQILTGALEAFPRFDPNQGGIRPWLAGIAERQASNLRRRAYRRRDVELTTAIVLAWLVNSGAMNAVGRGAGRLLLGVIVVVVGMLASLAPTSTRAVAGGRAGTTEAAVTGPGPAVGAAVRAGLRPPG